MTHRRTEQSLHDAPALMILSAGFINGALSRTMTAPFDRLRAVLATGREKSLRSAATTILQTQGLRGFWAANATNVLQVGPENAIAFSCYEFLSRRHDPEGLLEKFFYGSISGAVAMTVVYPLYVVQNRLAAAEAGKYRGMTDCIVKTSTGGRPALYAGFNVSLLRVFPLKGIMLGGYFTLKDFVAENGEISTGRALMCSAISGGMAHAVTYPMHLARTVLMTRQSHPSGRQYRGFVDVLKTRARYNGIVGCFAGLLPWLMNRIPAVAIEFAVNERALDALSLIWME